MKSSCTLNHQGTRIYYLDFLRIFLTIVVFYHHAAISFGASEKWLLPGDKISMDFIKINV